MRQPPVDTLSVRVALTDIYNLTNTANFDKIIHYGANGSDIKKGC